MSAPALPADLARRLREADGPIAVTGATGWLGRATLDLLAGGLGDELEDRVRAYASRPRRLALTGGREVDVRGLDVLAAEGAAGGLLLHFAYRTREQAAEVGEAAYVRDNVAITAAVLAAFAAGAPAGMLLPSSGAVYGADGALECDLRANPYGALKHLDELAFAECCREAGTRLVVARVFNVSGPPMPRPEGYALGSLILQARAGRALEVRARRPVRRSFVAIADLVAVALAALLDAEGPERVTFDTAGDEVVEVEDLARRVARALGRDLPVERELDPTLEADEYVGDGAALRALADRAGLALTPLDEQIRQTAAGLR